MSKIVIFNQSIAFATGPAVMPGRPVEMEDEADAQRFIKAGVATEAPKGAEVTATVPKQRVPKPRKPETAAVTPPAETATTPNPGDSNPVAVVALIEEKKVKPATKAQAKKATRLADGN